LVTSISIVIVHYKDNESLKHCLDLLNKQTLPPAEITIVDNSHDLEPINSPLKL